VDKLIIKNNFSKSAGTYDKYAVIQKSCAEKLASLCPLKTPRRILEIGCGTGVYTALLRKKYPGAALTAVDISGEMIDEARRNVPGQVEFMEADAERAEFDGRFGLVTSNASFHWFNEPGLAFKRFAGMLSEDGELHFSIYGPRTFTELDEILSERLEKRKWLYASGFMDAWTLATSLSGSFAEVDIKEEFYPQECGSLLGLMKGIKLTGTKAQGIEPKLFMGKGLVKELEAAYLKKYGSIIVTHHVFFVNARGML
jgi:malonyl-CoA O-methyltransferase